MWGQGTHSVKVAKKDKTKHIGGRAVKTHVSVASGCSVCGVTSSALCSSHHQRDIGSVSDGDIVMTFTMKTHTPSTDRTGNSHAEERSPRYNRQSAQKQVHGQSRDKTRCKYASHYLYNC